MTDPLVAAILAAWRDTFTGSVRDPRLSAALDALDAASPYRLDID